ncbi:MAG: DUF262 domain-containing protein [Thermoplasmata archaeon]|nr:DUF262 domain-containing protein [Candidatus Sysuiplasma acidicola]MBX8645930.1 DUF262 domain-containing protein [Candidatus Sysuiplasma acidicola]
MRQPKPDYMEYPELIMEIGNGAIKIPDFQRRVVWDIGQTLYLLDSISKGFPIGSFIFWQTQERMKAHRNIGDLALKESPDNQLINYILDGQQRLTSLYACIKGAVINTKKYQVFCDLDASGEDETFKLESSDPTRFVDIGDLLGDEPQKVSKSLSDERQKRFDKLRETFRLYKFPVIRIEDQPLDVVCEMFTRINNTGTELDLFDLMVAKTWMDNFNLRDKYNELSSNLRKAQYDELAASVVLQIAGAIVKGGCTRKHILSITRDDVTEYWVEIVNATNLAVDFLRDHLGIPSTRLLPYQSCVVPIAYFFYRNEFKQPKSSQARILNRYFWRSAAIERYSSGTESKLGQDIRDIDKLVKDEKDLESLFSWPEGWVSFTSDKIIRTELSLSNAFCKMILAFLASSHPLSFENNTPVRVDSSNLARSNSRHYHHFFPKAYLKKKGVSEDHANSVANICLVPAASNLHYQDNSPKDYLKPILEENPNLGGALKSHFIELEPKFGIETDDYDMFLQERADSIILGLAGLIYTNEEFDTAFADYNGIEDDN